MAERQQEEKQNPAAAQAAEEHNRAGAPRHGKEPTLTEHVDLGPGLVRTPGCPVEDVKAPVGPVFADRVIVVTDSGTPRPAGKAHVAEHPTLSTYEGKLSGVDGQTVKANVPEDAQAAEGRSVV